MKKIVLGISLILTLATLNGCSSSNPELANKTLNTVLTTVANKHNVNIGNINTSNVFTKKTTFNHSDPCAIQGWQNATITSVDSGESHFLGLEIMSTRGQRTSIPMAVCWANECDNFANKYGNTGNFNTSSKVHLNIPAKVKLRRNETCDVRRYGSECAESYSNECIVDGLKVVNSFNPNNQTRNNGYSSGLSRQSQGDNLNSLITLESKKAINFLDRDGSSYDNYRYTLNNKQIVYSDINHDGISDAIVGLSYCEKTNCHMTTRSFDLVVFIGTGNNKYTYGDSRALGLQGTVGANGSLITVETMDFNDNDPHCCPSMVLNKKYRFQNGSLVEVY